MTLMREEEVTRENYQLDNVITVGEVRYSSLKEACEAHGVSESAYVHARRRKFNDSGEYLTLEQYINRNKNILFRGKWYKNLLAIAKDYGASYDKFKRESKKEGFDIEEFITDVEEGRMNSHQSTVVNGVDYGSIKGICAEFGINRGSYYQAKTNCKDKGITLTIEDYVNAVLKSRRANKTGRQIGTSHKKPLFVRLNGEDKEYESIREACKANGFSATAFNTYKRNKQEQDKNLTIDEIFEMYYNYKIETTK